MDKDVLAQQALRQLQSVDAEERIRAASSLGACGKADGETIAALRTAENDSDPSVRFYATASLYRLTGKPEVVQTALVRELNSAADPALLCRWLEWAVVLGAEIAPATPNIIQLLRHWHAGVRQAAVLAIRLTAQLSSEITPQLLALLTDADVYVRCETVLALGKTGDSAVVTPLAALLRDGTKEIRLNAAVALASLGGMAQQAVPALALTLKDMDFDVRYQAADALAKIGLPDERHLMTILEGLATASPTGMMRILEAVATLNALGAPALPVLENLLKVVDEPLVLESLQRTIRSIRIASQNPN